MAIRGPAVTAADLNPCDALRSPSLATRANVAQARYTGGSQARMPAQPRVRQFHTSESQRSTQLVSLSASESITSHRLSGRHPQPHPRPIWFIRITQRTRSSIRVRFGLSASLSGPDHRRIRNTHWTSVPFTVSTPSARADGSPGRPVRSVPWAHGPSESMPVRAIRVSGSRAVSSLSQRKAPRPIVSQTRTPSTPPVGRCSAAEQPDQYEFSVSFLTHLKESSCLARRHGMGHVPWSRHLLACLHRITKAELLIGARAVARHPHFQLYAFQFPEGDRPAVWQRVDAHANPVWILLLALPGAELSRAHSAVPANVQV
jgi:hypothetical protein